MLWSAHGGREGGVLQLRVVHFWRHFEGANISAETLLKVGAHVTAAVPILDWIARDD